MKPQDYGRWTLWLRGDSTLIEADENWVPGYVHVPFNKYDDCNCYYWWYENGQELQGRMEAK